MGILVLRFNSQFAFGRWLFLPLQWLVTVPWPLWLCWGMWYDYTYLNFGPVGRLLGDRVYSLPCFFLLPFLLQGLACSGHSSIWWMHVYLFKSPPDSNLASSLTTVVKTEPQSQNQWMQKHLSVNKTWLHHFCLYLNFVSFFFQKSPL